MTEVLDHAGADWTPAERVVAIAIAEQVNDGTRRGSPDVRLIAHRAGIDVESLSKTLRRLAAKGTELRVATGVDRNGRPVYAHRGHRTDFQIPRLCPEDEHRTTVCMKRPDSGPALMKRRERPLAPESSDGGPAIDGESTDQSPANEPVSTDHRPAKKAERPDGGPERPDGGPALPLNTLKELSPQLQTPAANDELASTAKWGASDRKTSQSVGAHNTAKPPRQPPLFPPAKTLPEAVRIILDGLHAADYPHATEADARAVHAAVRTKHGHKVVPNYLRTMAANKSFGPFFDAIREERREEIEKQIRAIQANSPDCEHGLAGGHEPHPSTGQMLCPSCRNGTPASAPALRRRSHPAIARALDTYRAAGGILTAPALLRIGTELTSLHSRGATAEQLADLATAAARAVAADTELAAAQ